MVNFEHYAPTKVLFGQNAEAKAGELVSSCGAKKVLLHYGGSSAKDSGLLDRVKKSLTEANISFVLLGGVKPNPRLSKVYEGIELCKKEGVDFILAVGGGSVIDSAKAIAYGLGNDFDVWNLFTEKETAKGFFPLGSILTIAAAGSETSNSTVITKEEGNLKLSYNDDISRPLFAILNPELTYTLPEYQTMSGCVDILMHTMERYFTVEPDTLELTDTMAEALMVTVMKNAKILLSEPANYNARAEIMWAGSLSHNGLMGCGGVGDWASHRIEHEISGMFDVAHGAGLSSVWGSWARYVYMVKPERFARFAIKVMGVPDGEVEETAMRGIIAMEEFFRSIKMPTNMRELGVEATDEQIREMAKKCADAAPRLGTFRVLEQKDMQEILTMAR